MRALLLSLILLLAACGESYRNTSVTMVAKRDLDAQHYLGLWYEIARYPVFFQKGCTATTAEYGAVDDDTISVVNTCREGSPEGPIKKVNGEAVSSGRGG